MKIENKSNTEEKNNLNNINDEKIRKTKINLEKKIDDIKNKLEHIYDPYKEVIFNREKEDSNDILKKIEVNISINETLNKELKELKIRYLKLDNILKNLKFYYNKFFL